MLSACVVILTIEQVDLGTSVVPQKDIQMLCILIS